MKQSLKEYLGESILDPIREKLNPILWMNDKLKKSAKAHIVKKAEAWLKAYTDKKIEKMFLLGSMAGFQYNDTSDIDVNIVIPITDEKLKEMTKFLPNGGILPGGESHPINYFLSNKVKEEWKKAGSIYDILADRWIIRPKKDEPGDIVRNYRAIIEIARFFISGAESAIAEYNSDVNAYETYKSYLEDAREEDKEEIQQLVNFKINEILADLDSIRIAHKMIRSFRKEAFEKGKSFEVSTEILVKDANTSVNNLIYKYIEKLGYFSRMIEIENSKDKWEKLLK